MRLSVTAVVTSAIALAIVVLLIVAALFAPFLSPHNPDMGSLVDRLKPPAWQQEGSTANLLGTDVLGRDVLSRILYGARTSLMICIIVILLGGSLGSMLGVIAGYLGGWVDAVIMRIVDLAFSLPVILIAMLFAVVFGPSFLNIIIVLVLVIWSDYARMARGETLKVRELDFVALAKTSGCSKLSIMVSHVLPNVLSSLIVLATLQLGSVIIMESSLSFLGVGIPPPTADWGSMMADGRSYIVSAWWLCVVPGMAILLTVLSFNLLGDVLTEYLNPTLRRY